MTKVPFYNLTAKLNGTAHEYAWMDKHPDVCPVVIKTQAKMN